MSNVGGFQADNGADFGNPFLNVNVPAAQPQEVTTFAQPVQQAAPQPTQQTVQPAPSESGQFTSQPEPPSNGILQTQASGFDMNAMVASSFNATQPGPVSQFDNSPNIHNGQFAQLASTDPGQMQSQQFTNPQPAMQSPFVNQPAQGAQSNPQPNTMQSPFNGINIPTPQVGFANGGQMQPEQSGFGFGNNGTPAQFTPNGTPTQFTPNGNPAQFTPNSTPVNQQFQQMGQNQYNHNSEPRPKFNIIDMYWLLNPKFYMQGVQFDPGEVPMLILSYNADFNNVRLIFCDLTQNIDPRTTTSINVGMFNRKTTVSIYPESAIQLLCAINSAAPVNVQICERVFSNNNNWQPNRTIAVCSQQSVTITTQDQNTHMYTLTGYQLLALKSVLEFVTGGIAWGQHIMARMKA